jgi:regulator of cell morphogenesis and NO signaling
MMTPGTTKTVREIAVETPNATRIFEKLKIDYCCGGGKSLDAACTEAGIETEEVLRLLEEAASRPEQTAETAKFQTAPLAELMTYIVDKHHVFTREELDRLEPLLAKVCSVYGERRPELPRIQALFLDLKRELLVHMMKEEQVLFPYVRQLESATGAGGAKPYAFFGTVQNPVRMMMMEHDAAGDLLLELRRASSSYALPEDACASFRALYAALEEFERDLHRHIHLENNLLFPRAVELEGAANPI